MTDQEKKPTDLTPQEIQNELRTMSLNIQWSDFSIIAAEIKALTPKQIQASLDDLLWIPYLVAAHHGMNVAFNVMKLLEEKLTQVKKPEDVHKLYNACIHLFEQCDLDQEDVPNASFLFDEFGAQYAPETARRLLQKVKSDGYYQETAASLLSILVRKSLDPGLEDIQLDIFNAALYIDDQEFDDTKDFAALAFNLASQNRIPATHFQQDNANSYILSDYALAVTHAGPEFNLHTLIRCLPDAGVDGETRIFTGSNMMTYQTLEELHSNAPLFFVGSKNRAHMSGILSTARELKKTIKQQPKVA